jgi:hypothetical protein
MSRHEQKLLEGEVMDPTDNGESALREQLQRVTAERDAMRARVTELQRRVNQTDAPLAALRAKLQPFYELLQAVFGDLDLMDITAAPVATGSSSPAPQSAAKSSVWDSWKQKFPGAPASIITALQQHGEVDTSQLMILIGTSRRQTVADAIYKLNNASLINKNGGRFSLKQL